MSYTKHPIVGYGLTEGQIAVIKMQRLRFNATYGQLAKRYGVPVDSIRMIIESKQFDDIEPRGGYL
jgi:hypothetical protein